MDRLRRLLFWVTIACIHVDMFLLNIASRIRYRIVKLSRIPPRWFEELIIWAFTSEAVFATLGFIADWHSRPWMLAALLLLYVPLFLFQLCVLIDLKGIPDNVRIVLIGTLRHWRFRLGLIPIAATVLSLSHFGSRFSPAIGLAWCIYVVDLYFLALPIGGDRDRGRGKLSWSKIKELFGGEWLPKPVEQEA